MKLKTIAKCAVLGLVLSSLPLTAQNTPADSTKFFSLSRLTVGGYGEAVYTRNFYSDPRLPRYPNQKIWPYSDYIQHKLHMENDIRTGWCRTTPLWGRGLSAICTGRSDRLHDCRAQTVIEAIMWHGNAQSDARRTVEKFRELSKEDRDAVVKFIDAI